VTQKYAKEVVGLAYNGTLFVQNCTPNSVRDNWVHTHTDMEITNLISLKIKNVTNVTPRTARTTVGICFP